MAARTAAGPAASMLETGDSQGSLAAADVASGRGLTLLGRRLSSLPDRDRPLLEHRRRASCRLGGPHKTSGASQRRVSLGLTLHQPLTLTPALTYTPGASESRGHLCRGSDQPHPRRRPLARRRSPRGRARLCRRLGAPAAAVVGAPATADGDADGDASRRSALPRVGASPAAHLRRGALALRGSACDASACEIKRPPRQLRVWTRARRSWLWGRRRGTRASDRCGTDSETDGGCSGRVSRRDDA